jgi:hypothetical protein
VGSVKDIPELQVCTCIYLQYEGWCGVISDVVGQLVTNISLSWLSIIECMTIEHMVVAECSETGDNVQGALNISQLHAFGSLFPPGVHDLYPLGCRCV